MANWLRVVSLPVWLTFAVCAAQAAEPQTSGPDALAVATLVGLRQPSLAPSSKRTLAWLFDGRQVIGRPESMITIEAVGVTCRASHVDIAFHDCLLDFGKAKMTLTGRAANELFATLISAGVRADGAAGSVYAAVTNLSCKVDPASVARKDGGGANCHFTPAG